MATEEEEMVEEVAEMAESEGAEEGVNLSSSRSFTLLKIFVSWDCLSSSSWKASPRMKTRFLFTKLEVPALPETSQLMPHQVFLKLL